MKVIHKKNWYKTYLGFSLGALSITPDRNGFEIPIYYDRITLYQRGYTRAGVLRVLASAGLLTDSVEVVWKSGPGRTGNRLDIAFGIYEKNWDAYAKKKINSRSKK